MLPGALTVEGVIIAASRSPPLAPMALGGMPSDFGVSVGNRVAPREPSPLGAKEVKI